MILRPRTFAGIVDRVAALTPVTAAVAGATERTVVEGAVLAAEAGIISPILVGPADRVAEAVSEVPAAAGFPVVEAGPGYASVERAVDLVETGEAQMLAKGHVHTAVFLRPLIHRLRTDRPVSHLFVAEMPGYPKLLGITDAAVNIAPDLKRKVALIENVVELARSLGDGMLKVAALSAIEIVNPALRSTLDAHTLAQMSERGEIPGALVAGPVPFDAAVSPQAAAIKNMSSPVAGHADLVLVPDLDTGNILAKGLAHLAGATLAGVVLGARVPAVLTSRSDTPHSRLVSFAVAAAQHHLGGGVRPDPESDPGGT